MPEFLEWARFEQLVLRNGIISDASGIDSPKRSKTMRLGSGIEYVQHRTIRGYGCVGNQKPMAAPRNGFGAHDRRGLESRQRQKIFECLPEFTGLHIVGERPEARVSPLSVARVAPASPAAAE